MPPTFPSLLVDAGAFIPHYAPLDRYREPLQDFVRQEERSPTFGHWYTVDGVVGEVYSLLRREVSLDRAREFLGHLSDTGFPTVLHVPWREVAALLKEEPAPRLGRGFTFVDASFVVAARQLGARHVLTVNPRDFRPFGLQPVL